MSIKYFNEVGTALVNNCFYPMCEDGTLDFDNPRNLSDLDIEGDGQEWFSRLNSENQIYIKNLVTI